MWADASQAACITRKDPQFWLMLPMSCRFLFHSLLYFNLASKQSILTTGSIELIIGLNDIFLQLLRFFNGFLLNGIVIRTVIRSSIILIQRWYHHCHINTFRSHILWYIGRSYNIGYLFSAMCVLQRLMSWWDTL